jgi:hypothetical protein
MTILPAKLADKSPFPARNRRSQSAPVKIGRVYLCRLDWDRLKRDRWRERGEAHFEISATLATNYPTRCEARPFFPGR